MTERIPVLSPLPDEERECGTCHGEGQLGCNQGCHTKDCPDCDGTGYAP